MRPTMCYRTALPVVVLLLTVIAGSLPAGEIAVIPSDPSAEAFFSGPVPRSAAIIDDAGLHDVDSVGNHCWAVGDRGVLLRSTDGGATWVSAALPFDCTLTSLCFLTNQIGFVAGLRLDPYTRADQGILLRTRDGGETWDHVSPDVRLPGLRYVQFFGLEEGVVVTAPTNHRGGTLMVTGDGGRSWSNVEPDPPRADWVGAAFLRASEGLVAGGHLSYGVVSHEQLKTLGFPGHTLQSVNAVSLTEDGRAWMVGDGGFIRRSTNRGVSWKVPAGRFPASILDVFRFVSVVHDGDRVCVAGTPGSSVLRSEDSGATWTLVPCAESGAIHRLVKTGADSILAVGSWGTIMKSDDFGRSWHHVRHGNRRSALMYLVTDPDSAAPLMLARLAADEGYRVSVLQPSQDLRQVAQPEHWRAALSRLGVNTVNSDWRFVRTREHHVLSEAGLLKSWDQATDGRLVELLPLRLATHIRTWRPDVICIEAFGHRDGVAAVWNSAMTAALAIAAGEDSRTAVLDDAGLPRWSVTRVVSRSLHERSSLEFTSDELLPKLKTTAALMADDWYRHVGNAQMPRPQDVAYAVTDSMAGTSAPRRMFQGISLTPGGAARRAVPMTDPGLEELQTVVQQHHTQKSAVTGHVQKNPLGKGLIAYTQTIGRGLPQAMAKEQLLHMLRLFRERENLDCRMAVQKELARRFPNSPDAAQAVEELHLLYSSAEILTLRKRDRPKAEKDSEVSALKLTDGTRPTPVAVPIPGLPVPATTVDPWVLPAVGTSLSRVLPSQGAESDAMDRHWDEQAETAWEILQQLAPAAAGSARHLLIRAARHRRLLDLGKENTVLASATGAADSHRLLAANEMQATFNAVEPMLPDFKLPKGRERPMLDGLLSDLCWQHAPEIRLTDSQPGDRVADSLVMLSWDEEFLYLAGRLPTATTPPSEEAFDRAHDEADITGDYIEFRLDVDRDYSSSWHLVIDSAGRTADRCWQLQRWNPEWYVATQRDTTGWRFEAAIPVRELQDRPLAAGARWAVGIRRVVPGYADQQVEVSEAAQELDERFSIVRFIRNRRPE